MRISDEKRRGLSSIAGYIFLWVVLSVAIYCIITMFLPDRTVITVREATPVEKRLAALEAAHKADVAMLLAGCTCQEINAMANGDKE